MRAVYSKCEKQIRVGEKNGEFPEEIGYSETEEKCVLMAADQTTLLIHRAFDEDDPDARTALFESIHAELKRVAISLMRGERSDHTWDASDLLQECYHRMLGSKPGKIESRRHFFATARRMMCHLLIDHARHHRTLKAGGGMRRSMLEDRFAAVTAEVVDFAAFVEVLDELGQIHPEQHAVVSGHLISGLDAADLAALLELGQKDVEADLKLGLGFLYGRLRTENDV